MYKIKKDRKKNGIQIDLRVNVKLRGSFKQKHKRYREQTKKKRRRKNTIANLPTKLEG